MIITDKKTIDTILKIDIPIYRSAYSDRTVWLMACFAELAYLKFEDSNLNDESTKELLIQSVNKVLALNKVQSLSLLLDKFTYNPDQNKKELSDNSSLLGFQIIELFSHQGAEAILVKNEDRKRLVLAFRGTEPTSFKDIKSDIDARMKVSPTSKQKLHKGFSKAYDQIGDSIQMFLDKDEYSQYQLFITGHSLGGALASIAAKKLTHKGGISACYTFGSPKVGSKDWISNIKTPIYRVVNASDCVPLLPPGDTFISILASILKIFRLEKIFDKFRNYSHCGDMRYLTSCNSGDYSNVKLMYHTSFFQRVKSYILRASWKSPLADHSITTYRKKLGIIALNRN